MRAFLAACLLWISTMAVAEGPFQNVVGVSWPDGLILTVRSQSDKDVDLHPDNGAVFSIHVRLRGDRLAELSDYTIGWQSSNYGSGVATQELFQNHLPFVIELIEECTFISVATTDWTVLVAKQLNPGTLADPPLLESITLHFLSGDRTYQLQHVCTEVFGSGQVSYQYHVR